MSKIAIYPGTFDPITNGHIDILERAMAIFDAVIVTVAKNSSKNPLFTAEERIMMIADVIRKNKYRKVSVDSFDGLVVNYAKRKNAVALIRGLRATSDFEYEFQMALMNRKQAGDIDTIFLMPHEKYTYLTSSIVREIARHHGNFKDFVPVNVYKKLITKFQYSVGEERRR
jgi:pantetheine-phosphate adenylyltransferase